jgi:CHAT domain-containing protein
MFLRCRSFKHLRAQSANREAIFARLTGVDLLVLSTHARADLIGGHDPYFLLSRRDPASSRAIDSNHVLSAQRGLNDDSWPENEKLYLRDILSDNDLFDSCRIVIATSCETSLLPTANAEIDEAMGFPAVFLGAGCSTFVGTFWGVNDFTTSLVMQKFYSLVDRGADFVFALRDSAAWLRELTARRVIEILKEMSLRYSGRKKRDIESAQTYFRELDPDDHPFSHPVHWSGLAVHGRNAIFDLKRATEFPTAAGKLS